MTLKPQNAELFIGIVARIGVDTKDIVKILIDRLNEYNYETHEIHVTDLLKNIQTGVEFENDPTEKRYNKLIDACNNARKQSKMNDFMAKLAIVGIVNLRTNTGVNANIEKRTAYIINQIKRPEEFELLRDVYGEHYIQISCHSNVETRKKLLSRKIAKDHPEKSKPEYWESYAIDLMQKDEAEEDKPYGQRVREVFPLSDVVINSGKHDIANSQIDRFLRILFGDNKVTPTPEEYGMELANTASKRSSDLSRQVGAAIMNQYNEIQALGCNEVPKGGGGTYWEGGTDDGREFTLGRDANDVRKEEVLIDLVLRLSEAEILKDEYKSPQVIKQILFNRKDNIIKDSQIMDSLEYGRSIHAEMNAITDCARDGRSIRDCILYCNTFPCHNCAKHIVASGISKVVYLRPYPKSYAVELFSDSILVDSGPDSSSKVKFDQFIGICGPIYSRIFTKYRWKKDGGSVPTFMKPTAIFIRRTPASAYTSIEPIIINEFRKSLKGAGLLSIVPPLAPTPS